MRAEPAFDYRIPMSFVPSGSIAAAFAPLRQTFGSRLTMKRDGGTMRWCVDGLETVVELRGSDSVCVRFFEGGLRDAVLGDSVAPRFATASEYRLTAEGAKRLATDMLAFFGGTREPRFRFSGFREAVLVRS